ncbi:MAG: hypothetical protein COV67_00285 [Nitrospinae bacterium CG11_big_fil_rev_8_21_14_0_20_56_8]|nr:MAG: hypothetical protein COV67_00285 [Nitrospinae bacterium CG11_big_fil_rev_8_21_14_0_20_56_8]
MGSFDDEEICILIAIPNKGMADLLMEIISEMGYHPLVAYDKSAIQRIAKETISITVLIVDWELTRLHFPGILSWFKSLHPCSERYILIEGVEEIIREGIAKEEFCCFMKKPFNIQSFEKGVLTCVEEYQKAVKTRDGGNQP